MMMTTLPKEVVALALQVEVTPDGQGAPRDPGRCLGNLCSASVQYRLNNENLEEKIKFHIVLNFKQKQVIPF